MRRRVRQRLTDQGIRPPQRTPLRSRARWRGRHRRRVGGVGSWSGGRFFLFGKGVFGFCPLRILSECKVYKFILTFPTPQPTFSCGGAGIEPTATKVSSDHAKGWRRGVLSGCPRVCERDQRFSFGSHSSLLFPSGSCTHAKWYWPSFIHFAKALSLHAPQYSPPLSSVPWSATG